jgi:hypothetical protein
VSPEQFENYRHEAVHLLMELNKRCENIYHISDYPRWDYDLGAGTLIFSDQGVPKIVASIQVAGTTSTELKNWLWGWANENLPTRATEEVTQVRQFGESEGLVQLTESSARGSNLAGPSAATNPQTWGPRGDSCKKDRTSRA